MILCITKPWKSTATRKLIAPVLDNVTSQLVRLHDIVQKSFQNSGVFRARTVGLTECERCYIVVHAFWVGPGFVQVPTANCTALSLYTSGYCSIAPNTLLAFLVAFPQSPKNGSGEYLLQ
jgi:hypothetical protein